MTINLAGAGGLGELAANVSLIKEAQKSSPKEPLALLNQRSSLFAPSLNKPAKAEPNSQAGAGSGIVDMLVM